MHEPTEEAPLPPQFSEAVRQSFGLVRLSPDGRFVAVATDFRLAIRDVDSLQIVQLYTNVDEIARIEWSCDSLFVLCAVPRRGVCQVWSVDNTEWHCKIDEGPLGLVHARWAPDGRHIVSSTDHGMRLTVWSLLDRSVCYIRFPKYPVAGVDFSSDGRWLAVAQRQDCKDSVGVYDATTWEQVSHFPVASPDLAELRWAPSPRGARYAHALDSGDEPWLCVLNSALEYGVYVYSRRGEHMGTYTPAGVGLGAQLSVWGPAGQMLAVGGHEGSVRVLSGQTAHCVGVLLHPSTLRAQRDGGRGRTPDPLVFREELLGHTHSDSDAFELDTRKALARSTPVGDPNPRHTHFVALWPPPHGGAAESIELPQLKSSVDRATPTPRVGIGLCSWSADGRFLLSRNEQMPAVLWVWEASTLRLHTVIVMRAAVRAAHWHPRASTLAFCTSSAQLYLWSAAGVSVVALPGELELRVFEIEWGHSGEVLALMDKERFCCCYAPEDGGREERARPSAEEPAARGGGYGQEQRNPNAGSERGGGRTRGATPTEPAGDGRALRLRAR